jgi:hypothetical protein
MALEVQVAPAANINQACEIAACTRHRRLHDAGARGRRVGQEQAESENCEGDYSAEPQDF